jgi:glutaminyl-peptide cyclotransferase
MRRSTKIKLCFLLLFAILTSSYLYSQGKVIEYGVRVLDSYPHDKSSYTQGLFFYNNQLYESAGQYGESSFRKVKYQNGQILRILNFEAKYFIEGSCAYKGKVYILTWRERKGFVYDINDFKYLGEFKIATEGWGLTTDNKSLIMTDGSDNLIFMNPETFVVDSTLQVKMHGKPVNYLNELEYINGDIWANVYGEDYIVIIDKTTGRVKGKIDCSKLLPVTLRTYSTDVLNGIAYNPATKSLYFTGKYWPRLYKISIYKKR